MKKKLFVTFILLCFSKVGNSQTSEDIYNKYVLTIGGEEKVKDLSTIKYEGFTRSFKTEIDKFIVYRKRKDLYRSEVYKDSLLSFCNCYDGVFFWRFWGKSGITKNVTSSQNIEKAWTINDDSGGEALLNELIEYKNYGSKIELLNNESEGEKDFFVLKLIKRNFKATHFYINTKTFLIEKSIDTDNENNYRVYDDYRKVEGILIPHRQSTYVFGSLFTTLQYSTIKFNLPLDDILFKCEK